MSGTADILVVGFRGQTVEMNQLAAWLALLHAGRDTAVMLDQPIWRLMGCRLCG